MTRLTEAEQQMRDNLADILIGAGWSATSGAAFHDLGEAISAIMRELEIKPQVAPVVPDISEMVNRFLGWKLPKTFCPDAGITFKPDYNENTPWPMKHEPTGTNLFNAIEAKSMFEYCLQGQPTEPQRDERALFEAEFQALDLAREDLRGKVGEYTDQLTLVYWGFWQAASRSKP